MDGEKGTGTGATLRVPATEEVAMDVEVGDTIQIESNKVGTPPRRGTVNEVLQTEPLKLDVTWDDGHRTIIEPTGAAVHVVSDGAS